MATQSNIPQESPFAKLFSSAAQDAQQLQKIRDRIYHFAWSRDRRDEAKLDWVVSENGVDRNVHLRWIDESSSGLKRDHIDGLPCWLFLVNKQISADFTRFIYSVNDLDVLVDLKADHTEPNEAKLDTIVNLLHNANLQRYTKSARLRIHFPDKYPFQNLPVFNQHALENIAVALDGFQQLTRLSVRVVPMQGPEAYELRLATFPFYPMSMTNWLIRALNPRTYNWDVVGGEQLHELNLAWDLFQETGSLTATVQVPDDVEKPTIHIDQPSGAKGVVGVPKKLAVSQKKNGSQKRKDRKLKALTTVTAPSAGKVASEAPSKDTSLRSSSPSLGHSVDNRSIQVSGRDSGSGAKSSPTKLPIIEVPGQSAPEPMPADHNLAGSARQFSPLTSSRKVANASGVNAPDNNDEAADIENAAEQLACPANPITAAPEQHMNLGNPQGTSPSSSAPSSVTLGRDQSEDEAAISHIVEETPQVEATLRGAGVESEKPVQKKRRSRKKTKTAKLTAAATILSKDERIQENPIEPEDNSEPVFIRTINAQGVISMDKNCDGFVTNSKRTFTLADVVELIPWGEEDRLLQYKTENGRWGITTRSPDLDRLLRQKERMAAQATERQAEKMRSKGKRKTKKVKEIMIRRKGPSEGLLRRVEDTKQLAGAKQGSDLRKRFNEITGERQDQASMSHKSSEDLDSSDEDKYFQEGEWSTPEKEDYPQRDSSTRHENHDTSSVSHGRKPSRCSPAAGFGAHLPIQVFMFANDDNEGDIGSQVEHQDVEELGHARIGYNDETASFDSQDHHQRAMTSVAGQHENRSDGDSSETAAVSFASAYETYQHGHKTEEQRLVEELNDSDDCASVISHYGDDGPPSISDDECQIPNA